MAADSAMQPKPSSVIVPVAISIVSVEIIAPMIAVAIIVPVIAVGIIMPTVVIDWVDQGALRGRNHPRRGR
jgi:hypothetical protein